MTSPGPAFQEYTGSCHENIPVPVSSDLQSTDGLTVSAWVEIVATGTLSTILHHPTHNETLLLADI